MTQSATIPALAATALPTIRTGQGPGKLSRSEFGTRFRERFQDPAFAQEAEALARIEEVAWGSYVDSRKAPRTQTAGEEFADPNYKLSIDWLRTRQRLREAQTVQANRANPLRILLVNGSARNDRTCPSENSKTHRLIELARQTLERDAHAEVDVLDLSLLSSEYGRQIHPCKACVSTAMPLCHWPCSCFPNHSLGQTNDWMAEIYERWVLAHGVILVTPVYWYQTPSVLKLMMDRLVCADGGNPDPTTTQGKDPMKAKALELAGWGYPKHLAQRAYGVVAHGDAAGAAGVEMALSEWLDCMGLVSAGRYSKLERYIGYYEPYATSHVALDRDAPLLEEVRNVARAVAATARAVRSGEAFDPGANLQDPRAK
jgi:multimeric flavodoxin WrbA